MEIKYMPFQKVIKDITSKYNKIPKSEFLEKGSFQIIDQGKEGIAGYTNNKSLVSDYGLPVIVFGDHTRIIKYVNNPFAIGADGVKVLFCDKKNVDPKYLYFYLKSLNLPSAGYSRHFKFLKEKKIPVPYKNGEPDLLTQKRIAKVLSDVEKLIAKRKQSIQMLDEFLKATFLEMFGDPVRNEKGWEVDILKNHIGKVITGNTPPRKDPNNYGNFIEWIKTDNIESDKKHVTQAKEYLSEKGKEKGRIVNNGTLLVTCIAGSLKSIGNCALTNRKIAFNQQINAIIPFEDVNSEFLYWMFKISKFYTQSYATKGMKKIITKSEFEKIKLIKPNYDLQLQFSNISVKTETIKEKFEHSLRELENLYGSLSQKAFKGELDLSKVEIEETELKSDIKIDL